ncbi:hypothetical protein PGT21_028659 [Puccinia graminis f. sp. tritici]|uniref:Uncharacterized protein n=1 Tax=Puccinia graminis f. sp. tritici TaxID=56615 RepID=A0A5B0Q6Z7_PUCGR|nr:hypothetical protein PGT21_028659 [Puccinia graminis f. sp. tritici]KAA1122419.1 hypothetical protein PGTUg99_037516 [Puccinia graminis f. sp. tritici]
MTTLLPSKHRLTSDARLDILRGLSHSKFVLLLVSYRQLTSDDQLRIPDIPRKRIRCLTTHS